MYERHVSFFVGLSLSEVRSKLKSRINLPFFRFPDNFISFRGKEVDGVYHLAHQDRASRRVKIRLKEVDGGVEIDLEVKPTLIRNIGTVLGSTLVALMGLVSLQKNFVLGALLVAIGVAPLFIKKHTVSREILYIKSELATLFGVKC